MTYMRNRKITATSCVCFIVFSIFARVSLALDSTPLDESVKEASGKASAAAQAVTQEKKLSAPSVADAFEKVSIAPQTTDVRPGAKPAASVTQPPAMTQGAFSFEGDIGYLSGETVYDFNNHRSELSFPIDNVMIGSRASARVGESGSLHGSLWISAEDDAGSEMRNRDFTPSGHVTSDTRSDAELNVFIADVYGRYDFYTEPDELRIGALLGYSYERLDYDITGLYYEVDEINGFTGQTRYPGSSVITYLIEYHTPYLGVALDAEKKTWGVGAEIKYSFYPFAWDRDNHILRGLTFYGDYDSNGSAWLGSVHGFWNFRGNWTMRGGVDFRVISIDGKSWEENRDPQWDAPQSTDLRQVMLWSGLEYRF